MCNVLYQQKKISKHFFFVVFVSNSFHNTFFWYYYHYRIRINCVCVFMRAFDLDSVCVYVWLIVRTFFYLVYILYNSVKCDRSFWLHIWINKIDFIKWTNYRQFRPHTNKWNIRTIGQSNCLQFSNFNNHISMIAFVI